MARLVGLGLLCAACAAGAQPPIANPFNHREIVRPARPAPELRFKFETARVDYSEPARPERKSGFLASVQVTPRGYFGIGMSDKKPRPSAMAPDPGRDARRGGKKLALRYVLDF